MVLNLSIRLSDAICQEIDGNALDLDTVEHMDAKEQIINAIATKDDQQAAAIAADNPAIAHQHVAVENVLRGDEQPPLIHAAFGNLNQLLAVLLTSDGINVDEPGLDGAAALHWASWVGNEEGVRQLIAAGASIEARCQSYYATPLYWAAHGDANAPASDHPCRQVGAARLLLAAGADVKTRNRWHESPLDCAQVANDNTMFALLAQYDSAEGNFF